MVHPRYQDTQTLEVFTLTVNLLSSVIATLLAEGFEIHLVAGFANHTFNLMLDWQAVAIPARNIRCVKAAQGLGLNNNIFQNFVTACPI